MISLEYVPAPGYTISQRVSGFLRMANKRCSMSLVSVRLILESGDGSPAREYRLEDGNVEVRTLDPAGGSVRSAWSVWSQLTPEQLRIHVERNTVVAQWLERRLGWRRLVQACVDQEPSLSEVA